MSYVRALLSLVCSLTAILPLAGASAVEATALEGRWCLQKVEHTKRQRARTIGREWSFVPPDTLRVQSEANAQVRMSTAYELSGERLTIPDLGLELRIDRITDRRITAIDPVRSLRYRFARGRCPDDLERSTGTASDGDSSSGADSDAGGGRDSIQNLP